VTVTADTDAPRRPAAAAVARVDMAGDARTREAEVCCVEVRAGETARLGWQVCCGSDLGTVLRNHRRTRRPTAGLDRERQQSIPLPNLAGHMSRPVLRDDELVSWRKRSVSPILHPWPRRSGRLDGVNMRAAVAAT
jgi:hypothetical protein